MDEQRREFFRGIFDRVLNKVEPWNKEPFPSAQMLAWIVAVSDVAVRGEWDACEALAKELEPIAQESLDKRQKKS